MAGKLISGTIALFLLTALAISIPAQSDRYLKYLGTADVEKATDLKGIRIVPNGPDADGDLNFARADGQLILSASFYASSAYAEARSSETGFKSAVKGVGEDAFMGPADGPPLYILAFRKGIYAVVLNTELDDSNKPILTMEQLIAIAKIMAARI
jgi:hypothetical protein